MSGARDCMEGADPAVQCYRHMIAKGKPKQVAVTAIARELAGSSGPLPASCRILLQRTP